jgi:hypothetical protein
MAPGLSGKRYFKTFFDKPFPELFKTPPGQPCSFGYRTIRVIFLRKQ